LADEALTRDSLLAIDLRVKAVGVHVASLVLATSVVRNDVAAKRIGSVFVEILLSVGVELLLLDHGPDLLQGSDACNIRLVCDRGNSRCSVCQALIGVTDDLGCFYEGLLRLIKICRLEVLLTDNELGMIGFRAQSDGLVRGIVPV
jgi:hypothetical protein